MKSMLAYSVILGFLLLFAEKLSLEGTTSYTNDVPLTMDYFRSQNGTCILFGGRVESGRFFDGLRKRHTSSGLEFRKKSSKIYKFPDKLTVWVSAAADTCNSQHQHAGSTGPSSANEYSSEFMAGMQFQAFWKREFKLRPASLELTGKGRTASPTLRSRSADWWSYELSINSSDTPLTDSLVIFIVSPSGSTIARLILKL